MLTIDDLSPAQPVNQLPAETDARLHDLLRANLDVVFPAAALCVVHQGAVVLNQAWGWLDPDTRQRPTQPDTWFDLASVTKLFTVTAFLSLVSAGKVAIDDTIVTVLPEFGRISPRPIDGGQDPHSRERLPTPDNLAGKTVYPARVTFRHLLAHTSGLAPWRDVYNAAGSAPTPPDVPDPISRAERWSKALNVLWDYPFVDEPGQRVHYSDLGLMLLGEAVSRLNGTPGALDTAIRAWVTAPLGLSTVMFNPVRNGVERERIAPTEYDATWRQRRVWGEVHDENACGVGGVAGHAGLFAAARDVAALGQAWLTEDTRLSIKPELLREARQEQTNGERRGLGWVLKSPEAGESSAGDVFSLSSFGHTGFTGTSLWIDPERQLVVAALTNSVHPGRLRPGTFEFRRDVHTLLAEGL
ncbi:MAG: beta-lactamase family protein [Chloroflexi bacterium]|nr:beta-lactamase family protein [Chloroflexota bacterium]